MVLFNPTAGMRLRASDLLAVITQINTNTADIASLDAKPQAFLRATTNQTITSGSWQAVLFNSEDLDTHNGHSTSSNTSRYTAQVAGVYHVEGRSSFAANSTGHRGVRIAKGGTFVPGSCEYKQTTTADVWSGLGTCDVHLSVGEYVEVQTIQDSGSSVATAATANDVAPSMSVVLINAD